MQAYKLQAHGEDHVNAVLSGELDQKLGSIKLLPRYHIKVQEHLIQGDVMDG